MAMGSSSATSRKRRPRKSQATTSHAATAPTLPARSVTSSASSAELASMAGRVVATICRQTSPPGAVAVASTARMGVAMAQATSKEPQAQAGLRRLAGRAAGVSVAACVIQSPPITGKARGRGAQSLSSLRRRAGAKPFQGPVIGRRARPQATDARRAQIQDHDNHRSPHGDQQHRKDRQR